MKSLKGKSVFITGVTSGIGKACVYAFAAEGARLVISARRKNLVDEIAADIKKKYNSELYAFQLDVSSKKNVDDAIDSLPEEFKRIDILVNNAGMGRGMNKLYEDNPDGWEEMIDTNVKGLLYVTRAVINQMVERKEGHVINIGSIAGHEPYTRGAVYCASKAAVAAITKSLRMDVMDKNIRISTVDPGLVQTGFSKVRFYGDEAKAESVYKGYTPLSPEDIADAVVFIATRPEHVNIAQMIIFPTAQASSTMVHKEPV
ncbi:MAG TPA: SDR family NAD(P)-dependent oxidoreductase [Melioribacteraceae bacterium]|nr:SDR family NAD(P)-dependent oxidoreductase [Melioribacteraceae bacterium]